VVLLILESLMRMTSGEIINTLNSGLDISGLVKNPYFVEISAKADLYV